MAPTRGCIDDQREVTILSIEAYTIGRARRKDKCLWGLLRASAGPTSQINLLTILIRHLVVVSLDIVEIRDV